MSQAFLSANWQYRNNLRALPTASCVLSSLFRTACFGRQGLLDLRGSPVGKPCLVHWNTLKQGTRHYLTPCSTVLCEKLTILQPVKKFSPFYVTRRFITVFITAHHLSPSSARLIQSMPHSTSCRSILILSFHLCPGLTNCLLPSGLSSPHTCYIPCPSSWFDHLKSLFMIKSLLLQLHGDRTWASLAVRRKNNCIQYSLEVHELHRSGFRPFVTGSNKSGWRNVTGQPA